MSAPDYTSESPRSYLGAWIAALLLIVAFVTGLVLLPPSFEAPSGEAPSNLLFVGRFHPILVHAPVGALVLLVLIEFFCLTRRGEERYGSAALLALWVGSAGAIMAVFAGIMLSREGGYVSGNFTLHQSMGIIGTAGVLLGLLIRIHAMGQGNRELLHAYRAIFFLSFGIMGMGAHFGGNMSHGNKYLTEHAPAGVKEKMVQFEKFMLGLVTEPKAADEPVVAGTPANPIPTLQKAPTMPDKQQPPKVVVAPVQTAKEKLVFQHVILPIFEAKCNKCHNADKSKGDLRLDTFEMVMKGGENGANIVPGKPDESLSIQRILLAVDDDEHMPPDGKEQLTEGEIALLRWWVQQGASNSQKVAEAKFPPEVKPIVDEILKVVPKDNLSASNPSDS